jgi:O-methyltransferase/aklanonic acid methyltransferase
MDTTSYKSAVTNAFHRAAADYDQAGVSFFSPMGRRLVELVGPGPGQRVLDIGCGRGACLFPAATAVGPTGRVVGIDIAPAMVEHARAEVVGRGLDTVSVRVMDAERPAFDPASFDVVTGSFSVIFLPDAVEALARYAPLLADGGRLAFTSPVFTDDTFPFLPPVFTRMIPESVLRHLPAQWEPHELARRFYGWLGTPERVTAALHRAGFTDVTVHDEPVAMVTGSGAEWVAWSHTQGMRLLWDNLPPAQRAELAATLTADLDALRGPDGLIRLPTPVRYVIATVAR